VLTAAPLRRDFSPFQYLALWLNSGGKLRVEGLRDCEPEVSVKSGGKWQPLKRSRANASAMGWERWYFELPSGLADAQEVRFELDGIPDDGIRLDDIVLTHEVRNSESDPLIDDFEKKGGRANWTAEKGAGLQWTRDRTLAVSFKNSGEDAVLSAEPKLRDWRKAHSIALRAKGAATIRVELVDETGRKGLIGTAESGPAWKTLHLNMQANFYPNTLNLKYDKEKISKTTTRRRRRYSGRTRRT
jgi:hypothetical protein